MFNIKLYVWQPYVSLKTTIFIKKIYLTQNQIIDAWLKPKASVGFTLKQGKIQSVQNLKLKY